MKKVARSDGQFVNYRYDGLGRRVDRTLSDGSWTKFVYDALNVFQDQKSDGSSVKYINGFGIDDQFGSVVNNSTQYFLKDHLGSTNKILDASGNVVETTAYDSFGKVNTPLSTRYQYTGREFDEFSGLHYYRARWYDSNLGSFMSEDPIGMEGGRNWYSYVNNNPISFIDSFGLAPNPGFEQRCSAWKKAIQNIEKDISKRIGEMAEDKLNLPWSVPGDQQNPRLSRRGHRDLIHKAKARKAELEGYVKAFCGDKNDRGGGIPQPVPVIERSPEVCNKRGRTPLTQPSMFELQMEVERARYMEKFWKTVLVGSAVGGTIYLAPSIIPAVLPQLPRLVSTAPQFAN